MSSALATAVPHHEAPTLSEPPPVVVVVEDCTVCDTTDADGCPACNATGTIVLRVR
jgi:hypothetical protein